MVLLQIQKCPERVISGGFGGKKQGTRHRRQENKRKMGCFQSRVEREETVSLCKARRGYMKQVVKGRRDFATAYLRYLHSLRRTGATLLQLANAETHAPDHLHHLPPLIPSPPPTPPPPPRQPPPRSKALNSALPPPLSATASSTRQVPPPPLSGWRFRDPFAPSSRSVTVEAGDEAAATVPEVSVASSNAATVPSLISMLSRVSKDPTSELAVVVSRKRKDLAEIVRELEEFFEKAADAGNLVAMLLEPQNCGVSPLQGPKGKACCNGRSLRPLLLRYLGPNSKLGQFSGSRRPAEETIAGRDGGFDGVMSHSSTLEKLFAWEKKLYLEVKNAESLREERQKRMLQLRKQEAKGVDSVKVEKNRNKIERLESKMAVASLALETISSEIMRLRESELFPQLLELLHGLKSMWKSMYEYHHVQAHIAQQLEYLTTAAATSSAANSTTSVLHQQSTLQLELAVQRWHSAFCTLVRSHRDYIHSLAGWLRLSLFQFHPVSLPRTQLDSEIYALCEEWQLALDRVPDKAASEGFKSLQTAIHTVVLQQEEEERQRRRWESTLKTLGKKAAELTTLEREHGSSPEDRAGTARWSPLLAKRAKVEALRGRAEEEKAKYEKSAGITREMMLSNLQTALPNVFQAMMAFSGVRMEAFEAVYDHHRAGLDRERGFA